MTPKRFPLILASASTRRLDLLRQVGIDPDLILNTEVDETITKNELPRLYARRMAETKLRSALDRAEGKNFILAADTVVACGRRVLDKPSGAAEARLHLQRLSGRQHRVITCVAVASPDGDIAFRRVETKVRFKRLSQHEAEHYIQSDEWQGKAGGYAIQGMATAFIPAINGSYSNVVGLPLTECLALLRGLGFQR